LKSITQTFNDGILSIGSISNIAEAGEYPCEQWTLKIQSIPFENRTVGMTRFWQGKQLNVQIDRLIRCPKIPDINLLDVIVFEDGDQYEIIQVQYPREVTPQPMDISIQKLKVKHDFEGR
jgi:hypothetical protein